MKNRKFKIKKLDRVLSSLEMKMNYVNYEYYYPKHVTVSNILIELNK